MAAAAARVSVLDLPHRLRRRAAGGGDPGFDGRGDRRRPRPRARRPDAGRPALKAALGATLVKSARHLDAFETAFEASTSRCCPAPARPPRGGTGPTWRPSPPPAGEVPGSGESDLEELVAALFAALRDGDPGLTRARGSPGGDPARRDGAGAPGGRHLLPLPGAAPPRPRCDPPAAASPRWRCPIRRLWSDGSSWRRSKRRLRGVPGGASGRDPPAPRGGPRARGCGANPAPSAGRGHRSHHRHPRGPRPNRGGDPSPDPASWRRGSPGAAGPAARGAPRRPSHPAGGRCPRAGCRSTRGSAAPDPASPTSSCCADISGSVATFARFTMQIVYAIAAQFSRVRSFAFIDTIDEVTGYFGPGTDFAEALRRMGTEAEVVWLDGHSRLRKRVRHVRRPVPGAVSPRYDGDRHRRCPHQLPRPRSRLPCGESRAAAGPLYWLNPERRIGTGTRATR